MNRRPAVVVPLTIVLLCAPLPSMADQPARIERAWSTWTSRGGVRVGTEGMRLTGLDHDITVGRVSRGDCDNRQVCTSSSIARPISAGSFDLNIDLSRAALSFRAMGDRVTATWRSDGLTTEPSLERRAATFRRAALADGEISDRQLPDSQLKRARMIAGATLPTESEVVPPQPSPGPLASPAIDSPCWRYRTSEKRFARRHNRLRVADGLGRLRLDPELSRAARLHTREMISKDLLHHTTSLELTTRITGWSILGENVGVGSTVVSLMDAFMDSPAHRANILHRSYRYVGIGAKLDNGRLWVTIIFEAGDNPSTSLRMPRC